MFLIRKYISSMVIEKQFVRINKRNAFAQFFWLSPLNLKQAKS